MNSIESKQVIELLKSIDQRLKRLEKYNTLEKKQQ